MNTLCYSQTIFYQILETQQIKLVLLSQIQTQALSKYESQLIIHVLDKLH